MRRGLRTLMLLLATGMLAGCSGLTPPVAPEDVAAIEARADQLYAAVAGDPVQRDAANYLQWIDLNSGFWSCMAAAGYEPRRNFTSLWRGWAPNGTSGEWLGKLQNKPSQAALAKVAARKAATSRPVPPGDPVALERTAASYDAASRECDPGMQVAGLGDEPGVPQGSVELMGAFNAMVDSVDASLGPIASYRVCMAAAGVDYRRSVEDADGWQALYLYLTGKMPKAPAPGKQPTQRWQDYLVLEAAALDADEACRGEQYRRGLALLQPKLEEFATQHADELTALETGWEATVGQAQAVGFVS